jgi:hypothetical protein
MVMNQFPETLQTLENLGGSVSTSILRNDECPARLLRKHVLMPEPNLSLDRVSLVIGNEHHFVVERDTHGGS